MPSHFSAGISTLTQSIQEPAFRRLFQKLVSSAKISNILWYLHRESGEELHIPHRHAKDKATLHFKCSSQAQEMWQGAVPLCGLGLGSARVMGLPAFSWSQGITTHEPAPAEPHLGTTSAPGPPQPSALQETSLAELTGFHECFCLLCAFTLCWCVSLYLDLTAPLDYKTLEGNLLLDPVPCTWFMFK